MKVCSLALVLASAQLQVIFGAEPADAPGVQPSGARSASGSPLPATPQAPAPRPALGLEILNDIQAYQAKVLAKFDVDHDGKLNPDELKQFRLEVEAGRFPRPPMPPIPKGPLPPDLRRYDKDGDGNLDEAERTALEADVVAGKISPMDGPQGPPGGAQIPGGQPLLPGYSAEAQLSRERKALMRPDAVVAAMNLQPGSVAVDIGSGHGLFTFPVARAVGKSGTVFATDVDPGVLASLGSRGQMMNLSNIVPMRVSPVGVDFFYKTHRFDCVLMCDSLQLVGDPEIFLRELKPSVKPNGRLWVLALRLDSNFSPEEFGSSRQAQEALAACPVRAVLEKRLRPATLAALAKGSDSPDAGLKLFLEDLNLMLNEASLYAELLNTPGAEKKMDLEEKEVRDYLWKEFGAAASSATTSPKLENSPQLRLLNRLGLQDLLNTRIWEKAFSLDRYKFADWKFLIGGMEFDTRVVDLAQHVGFSLVRQHQILDCSRIWEFRPEAVPRAEK